MGPALVAFGMLVGIALACAFTAAAGAAAAWRSSRGGDLSRPLGAVLLAVLYSSPLFGLVNRWARVGPGFAPGEWPTALLAAGLAVGATLAVRTGTAREVLAATFAGLIAAVGTFVACGWYTRGPGYLWPGVSAAAVPAVVGLLVAPLQVRRLHLAPARTGRPAPGPPAPWDVPPRPAR